MNKRRIFLLLGILALAITLRVIGINSRGIEYDDAFSIFLSARPLADIVRGTAADTMPPLYYFLLHFWQQIGKDLVTLRLLSVLLSLGTLAFTYDLVRRAWGWQAASWTAFLVAISPIQIYHAQDLRMYALLVFGQIGYLWCFYRLFLEDSTEQHNRILWAGMIFFGLIAMYSHNLAVFGLAIPDLYLLFKRKWRGLRNLILGQAVIGLLALPWLVMVPGQIEKIQRAFWTPRPGFAEVVQALIQFSANLPLSGIPFIFVAILSVQILVMVVLEAWKNKARIGNLGFFVGIALVPPVLLFIASYLIRPVFVARGFLIASIGYYALIGVVLALRWDRGPGPFLAMAFGVSVIISLPSFYTFDTFPRSPFDQAAEYLTEMSGLKDLVVHENKLSFFPIHYYQDSGNQVFLADEAGSSNDTYAPASQSAIGLVPMEDLEVATQGFESVYFVFFSQIRDEYRSTGLEDDPNLTWLEEHFQLAGQKQFNDLEILHYVRPAS